MSGGALVAARSHAMQSTAPRAAKTACALRGSMAAKLRAPSIAAVEVLLRGSGGACSSSSRVPSDRTIREHVPLQRRQWQNSRAVTVRLQWCSGATETSCQQNQRCRRHGALRRSRPHTRIRPVNERKCLTGASCSLEGRRYLQPRRRCLACLSLAAPTTTGVRRRAVPAVSAVHRQQH